MRPTHVVRSFFLGMPSVLFGGEPGERAGEAGLACHRPEVRGGAPLHVSSAAFPPGGHIPVRYTAEGRRTSPPLIWSDVPAQTKSFVVMVEDPDAPTPLPFVYWVVYGLSKLRRELPEGIAGIGGDDVLQGRNSAFRAGYAGLAPPRGDRPHRYHFQVFALDTMPSLRPGLGHWKVLHAMKGHVCGFGELVAMYRRLGP
jgi:Raf kinase inhibitor-like YbhB/YbcL family protein